MAPATTIDAAAIAALSKSFSGELIEPAHADYDGKRKVWNDMIDRRPGVIARPTSVEDIVAVVNIARESGAQLAVRCGGHNAAGMSTCDGGIVLDLSSFHGITVDPAARTASVLGGTLIGELDTATQAHGLAVPMGTVSHTGVGGLTLGGGLGRLQRLHGLSIDNLIAVEVVTADGSIVRASEDENADLFWGIRGAGPNFGVVTRFEFRLHPVGPDIGAFLGLIELDHAFAALRELGPFTFEAPDELLVVGSLMTVPPQPPFAPQFHGKKMLMVGANHFGSPDSDEAAFKPLADIAPFAFNAALRIPFVVAQQLNDEHFRWGKRYYEKGNLLREVNDDVADGLVAGIDSTPGPENEVLILPLGGAANRVPEDAMAYSGRNATHFFGINCAWTDPAEDDAHRGWARELHGKLKPSFVGANYVNSAEPSDDLALVYGAAKLEKLRALKLTWDPGNVFRLNNNITP